MASPRQTILALARKRRLLRSRDLKPLGIAREYLVRLCQQGLLVRRGRGLYAVVDSEPAPQETLLEAVSLVPQGVACLLSALRLHGLTTQNPLEIWLALRSDQWHPRHKYPPLRIVRMSGKALTSGVEKMTIEGVSFKVFCPAKTVADCFKYRNKIGLDVALEALRECWRTKRATMDELVKFATICRVERVMRPYLESLV